MVFTAITVEHVVTGRGVNLQAVRRAVALSARRYCSVSAMLEASLPVEVTYRVVDEAAEAAHQKSAGHLAPGSAPATRARTRVAGGA